MHHAIILRLNLSQCETENKRCASPDAVNILYFSLDRGVIYKFTLKILQNYFMFMEKTSMCS